MDRVTVFKPRGWEERLRHRDLGDPVELVRIHRLLTLTHHYADSNETQSTLKQVAEGDDQTLAPIARTLLGDSDDSTRAGRAIAEQIEGLWATDGFSLTLALRALQQLIGLLPEVLDGPVIEGLLTSDNHGLVEEVIKLIERRKELTAQCEQALIARLEDCSHPIAMRCKFAGTPRNIRPSMPLSPTRRANSVCQTLRMPLTQPWSISSGVSTPSPSRTTSELSGS